jgi:hypothetical protein
MTMEARMLGQRFSLSRIALLLRNRFIDEASVLGIGASVVVALNLLGILLSRRAFFNAQGMIGGLWIPTIAIAGILLASQAFKGMHDGKSGTDWILLPATPLEKYCAAFIDLVLAFPLAAGLGGAALSTLLGLLERAAGGAGAGAWSPFGLEALRAWADYAAAATIFLAGSAAFRKASFIKTVGMVTAYCLVLGLLVMLAFPPILGGGSAQISLLGGEDMFRFAGRELSAGAQSFMKVLSSVARYAIFPAFAVLFGAAKIAEKESRDEVQ